MASINVPLGASLAAVGILLTCCLPAWRLVARRVERKPHTSTVAGAVFVGLLIAPLALVALSACNRNSAYHVPVAPPVAALTVAYILGEGLGRLACISFGCCYGKPIAEVGSTARRFFEKFHFAFHGRTKKIAYASDFEGIKVVPMQALTTVLYVSVGLLGMLLFLETWFRAAYALTIVFAQGWRVYSETLRADYRGGGRVSVYQKMTLAGLVYALVVLALLPPAPGVQPHLAAGLGALWNPAVIIALQSIWVVIFLSTGWSMVTGSVLSFHVHHDRV